MSRCSLSVTALLAAACLQLVCGGRVLLASAPGPAAEAETKLYFNVGPFKNLTLPPLPYPNNALEPNIDEATMRIHHDVHNQAYVTNVNNALVTAPAPVRSLTLLGLNHYVGTSVIPRGTLTTAMRNNAGGAWNHAFFFKCMTPRTGDAPNAPPEGGPLAKAIDSTFGDFTTFKANFTAAATARFGSGFAWLIVKPFNKLSIISTPNQDNPLQGTAEEKGIPILNLDVWEHAYYLKYNASRPTYIRNWWNTVNWPYVEENYKGALLGAVPMES